MNNSESKSVTAVSTSTSITSPNQSYVSGLNSSYTKTINDAIVSELRFGSDSYKIGVNTKELAKEIMEEMSRKIIEEDDASLLEMINALVVEQISKLADKSTDDLLKSVVAGEINTNITIQELRHDINTLLEKVNNLEKENSRLKSERDAIKTYTDWTTSSTSAGAETYYTDGSSSATYTG